MKLCKIDLVYASPQRVEEARQELLIARKFMNAPVWTVTRKYLSATTLEEY